MSILAFVGVAAIVLVVLHLLLGYRKGKRQAAVVRSQAFDDYMHIKQTLKAWMADRSDASLRRDASECADRYREVQRFAMFTRAADVKSAEQAGQFTYAQQFASLELIDRDFVHGDLSFMDALVTLEADRSALAGGSAP